MAATMDPVQASEREVMQDISYFEGYELKTPPATPPMKSHSMMLKERTEMHISLEKMFPTSPPQTPPRLGLKRSFSSFGVVTPPITPPTRFSSRPSRSSSLSGQVHEHQISLFKSRPTISTIDITNSPSLSRRSTISRSSSYSAHSTTSATSTGLKDPLDRVRIYSAVSTDSLYPSPTLNSSIYSPPPNTPATFAPEHQIHDYSSLDFAFSDADITSLPSGHEKESDPFTDSAGLTSRGNGRVIDHGNANNPFTYTGPTLYPNHSSQPGNVTNGYQYPARTGTYDSSTDGSSIIDLEKARNARRQQELEDKPSRHCGRKAFMWFLFALVFFFLGVLAVFLVIEKIRHHYKN